MHNERDNRKARDKEANSREQSFSGYLKEHRDALLQIHRRSNFWEELHDGFALYDVELQKRGNGFVFRDKRTGTMEKASSVDRELSRKKLEDKYGPFQPDKNRGNRKPEEKYRRRPLDPRLEHHPAWKRMTDGQDGKRLSWRRFLEQQAGVDAEAREALELQKSYLQILSGQEPLKIKTRQIRPRKSKGISR